MADVGATKTVLAVAETDGSRVVLSHHERIVTSRVERPETMMTVFLAGLASAPRVACLAVPGPVLRGRCTTTNLPWTMADDALARACGLDGVLLVNDVEAAARGVLATPARHLVMLQGAGLAPDQLVAVLAPGSGCGEAVVVPERPYPRVLASEGGHADFAPRGARQRALAADLEAEFGHVSVERVLSGPGLARIYQFLVTTGLPPAEAVAAAAPRQRPEAVAHGALVDRHPTCRQALELFAEVLGAEAGNLALRSLALGGVVVTGGIAPQLLDQLAAGGTVAAFLAKGRMQPLLETVPLAICTDPDTPLRGAALLAVQHGLLDR